MKLVEDKTVVLTGYSSVLGYNKKKEESGKERCLVHWPPCLKTSGVPFFSTEQLGAVCLIHSDTETQH